MMVRVAAAQMRVTGSVDKNVQKILDFLEQAKSKQVDIICFPEVCLNYSWEKAVDVNSKIKKIQEACKKNSIWCIVGSYVHGKDVRNRIFLIDRFGKIKYRYDKVNLWRSEKGNVFPGKKNKVVRTEFGDIGIINCWDYAFPSYIQKLAKKAKIIFCPSYLVDYKKEGDTLKWIPLVRAFDNLAFFISCDAFTPESLSESYICHPLRILKKIKKEGMIYADLDLSEIDSLRKYFDHL